MTVPDLTREIQIAFIRRKADNKVVNRTYTVEDFIKSLVKTAPRIGEKDGDAFLQGSFSKVRNARNADVFPLLSFDIENGESIDSVEAKLRTAGLLFVIYPTHSDMRPLSFVLEEPFAKLMQETKTEKVETARMWFGRKGWTAEMLGSIHRVERKRNDDGEPSFAVHHDPLPRMRIVLFLREPFRFMVDDKRHKQRCAEWEARYRATARRLGIVVDASCATADRLMYLPSHAPDATSSRKVTAWKGDLLDLDEASPEQAASSLPAVIDEPGDEVPLGIISFSKHCWGRFLAAQFVEDRRGLLRHRKEDGIAEALCPDDGEHTNPDQGSYFIRDATETVEALMGCRTNGHCKDTKARSLYREYKAEGEGLSPDAWVAMLKADYCLPSKEITTPKDASLNREPIEWPFIIKARGGECHADHGHPDNLAHYFTRKDISLRLNTFAGYREVANGAHWRRIRNADYDDWWSDISRYGYRPQFSAFRRFLNETAGRVQANPVAEYLHDSWQRWDRASRIDTWLSDYLGVENTPLHRAFGRVFLIGAVWRALQPGCKFDYMLVLEGVQGQKKSLALEKLAGASWFTNQLRLGSDAKKIIEQTPGKWIVETAELSGMAKSQIEDLKRFITDQVDIARGAYEYVAEECPRHFVMVGTTNEVGTPYLRDQTGNRRFLPVEVGRTGPLDPDGIEKIRDQLWGEATAYVLFDELPVLPEALVPLAREAQALRTESDPITERLDELFGDVESGRIEKEAVWRALGMDNAGKRDQRSMNTITRGMRKLGWSAKQHKQVGNSTPRWCFEKRRGSSTSPPQWLIIRGGNVISAELVTEPEVFERM